MIRGTRLALMLLLAGTTAACGRLGYDSGPRYVPPPAYEPLPAAPTAPVQQSTLQPLAPPPPGAPTTPPPGQPTAEQPPAAPTKVAVATPPPGGGAVSRTDLLGGWRISGADNCQLFMNLTSWAGGYRAISKGCSSPDLQKISAWDLQGKQVRLKGSDGSTVATLSSVGGERFVGSTSASQPLTVSR